VGEVVGPDDGSELGSAVGAIVFVGVLLGMSSIQNAGLMRLSSQIVSLIHSY
jgi:hypothetical protein